MVTMKGAELGGALLRGVLDGSPVRPLLRHSRVLVPVRVGLNTVVLPLLHLVGQP